MAKGKGKSVAVAIGPDKDYRAESDHRTLREAAEIQGDKGRLGAAAAHAKKQMEANAKVAGLHKRGLISDKALSKLRGLAGAQPGPAVDTPDAGTSASGDAAPSRSQFPTAGGAAGAATLPGAQ